METKHESGCLKTPIIWFSDGLFGFML